MRIRPRKKVSNRVKDKGTGPVSGHVEELCGFAEGKNPNKDMYICMYKVLHFKVITVEFNVINSIEWIKVNCKIECNKLGQTG